MKAAVCSIVFTALLVHTAYSISCYVCTERNMNCHEEKMCADNEHYCVSNVTKSGDDMLVRKYCSTTCIPTTGCSGGPALLEYHCCGKNYCNFAYNGAAGVKTNYAILTVAVGVSAFLLRAGL